MGKDALRLSTVLAATPQVIFRAWLDSAQHASFTNALAKIDGNIGGKFSLRDGKVTGRTMALEFGRRLLQSWRNTDFPKGAPDSRLEVLFESVGAGTRITVMHADLPEGMGEPLRSFWTESYFGPMTDYFGRFATLLANTPPSQAVILVEDDEEEPEPPKPKKKLKVAPEKTPEKATEKPKKATLAPAPEPLAKKKLKAPPPSSSPAKSKPAPEPKKAKAPAKSEKPKAKSKEAPPAKKPAKATPKKATAEKPKAKKKAAPAPKAKPTAKPAKKAKAKKKR